MITGFARVIVRHRVGVLAVAALLVVVGVFGMLNTSINYDMLAYLPADLESVQGFEILTEDFSLGNTAQVMLVGAPEARVAGLADRVADIEGVADVTWVDDLGDLAVPREFWPHEMAESYVAGEATYFQVSFAESANDPLTRSAVNDIRGVMDGEEAYIAGVEQLELEDVINSDRTRFAIAAVGLVSLVLLLTIPSVIVPLLFVLTIGLAVVYNLGMSYFIGQEMSYLTGVIVLALQFAVTMDYALFLYHRYEQERANADNEEAMVTAIATTFKSVAAAALTTTAGFLALMTMRLGFGADMGGTLARGVIITLIATLTILPALLLVFDKPIRRFAHRTHMPDFARLGGWLARRAVPVTVVFALLFIPAVWSYSNLELSYDLNRALPEDLPALQATDRLAEEFGRAQSFFVVAEDTGRVADLDRLTRAVSGVEGVSEAVSFTSVVPPLIPAEFVPDGVRDGFVTNGFTYVVANTPFDFSDERTGEVIAGLRAVAAEYPGSAYVSGQGVLMSDLEDTSRGDVSRVNWLSIVAIALIVAVFFRSLAVPALLLAAIQLAILANQGISALESAELIFVAALAIGAIQLGATVDYAIVLASRYEEELRRVGDREQAMRTALGGAAPSILVSAATMFAATIGLVFLSSVSTVTDLTMLIARGSVISFASVIFLLPAVLVAAQPLLQRASVGWPRLQER